VTESLRELVSERDPLLLHQHTEAPEGAVVRVQQQLHQRGDLGSAVPPVTDTHVLPVREVSLTRVDKVSNTDHSSVTHLQCTSTEYGLGPDMRPATLLAPARMEEMCLNLSPVQATYQG